MAKRRAATDLRGPVMQIFQEIVDEKRPTWPRRLGPVCVYWRCDKIAERVATLLEWKRLNERRLRRISGTISGLIRSGQLLVHVEWPHGNRGITLA